MKIIISIVYGLIIDLYNDQLIAQLVEHCTGIEKFRVQAPVYS